MLKLKVKCWFVSKIDDIDPTTRRRVTKYEYRDTIRPITSHRNDPILSKFLKDAMSHFDTKLLLLIQVGCCGGVLGWWGRF